MPSPKTAQDVLSLVRQSGLIGDTMLSRFACQLSETETRDGVLSLLTANGLLTRYQATELASGQSRGLLLGGYRVLDRLGKGGMSHVYLGEHSVLGKRVALKVLSASLRADKIARRRFVREARTAAAIEHPNIVHVFDVDMDHDPPYLVMEFVDGINLQAAVATYGSLAGGESAAIGTEVARGLVVAADAGLVHRDIKPANLLLDRRGGVKILDLGIVRLLGDDTHPPGNEPDEILGTLDYLAPEQAEDSTRVDARADLYALGATLYFLLAGHPTFPGPNIRHKVAAKLYSDPPPIHRLRPDVEPALSAVIHTLLARNPAARYQTAHEALAALLPFSELPADFPMRFFRPKHGSTVTDGVSFGSNSTSPPETQSIRKPGFRIHQESRRADSSSEMTGDSGPPTVRISKALTDMMLTVLPDAPPRDDTPAPQKELKTELPVPKRHMRIYLQAFWYALFVVITTLVIIAIALNRG